jgi:hypothetical protein
MDIQFNRFDYLTRMENVTVCVKCKVPYHAVRKITFVDGVCSFCQKGKIAAPVLGVSSLCADGKHFLMWDFDNTHLLYVLQDLMRSQEAFHLSDIYILQSSPGNNYQAVCFDKFTEEHADYILRYSRCVDFSYRYIFSYRSRSTLRITPKVNIPIKYQDTIKSKYALHEIAYGPAKLYSTLFDIDISRIFETQLDCLDYVMIEAYISRHVGAQHYGP